ncbi:MAG: hypothetical protein JSR76_05410 [Verrucomicrobia bacterium]|nr:hypothetical protein [Verrucomicrobiota bacterium]
MFRVTATADAMIYHLPPPREPSDTASLSPDLARLHALETITDSSQYLDGRAVSEESKISLFGDRRNLALHFSIRNGNLRDFHLKKQAEIKILKTFASSLPLSDAPSAIEHITRLMQRPLLCPTTVAGYEFMLETVRGFSEQTTHAEFGAYLLHKHLLEEAAIQQEFLTSILPTLPLPEGFEELSLPARCAMFAGASFTTNWRGFGCTPSSWHPSQLIDRVFEVLTTLGPFALSGQFGREFYRREPTVVQRSPDDRDVWGWRRGEFQEETRAPAKMVIVIGAERIPDSRVFYVDPSEGTVQKVYTVAYAALCGRAFDLIFARHPRGGYLPPPPDGPGYALHGPATHPSRLSRTPV